MIEVRAEPASGPVGRRLLGEMVSHLAGLYGEISLDRTPSATPEDMGPPGGTFLVIYEDGEPVACGGVKRLGPGLGEIKRMYVVPGARRRGHARRMLVALEDAARELRHERVRLDTGELQPEARALYESSGYHPIPDYNQNAYAAFWFEKDLTAP